MQLKDIAVTLGSYLKQPAKRKLINYCMRFKGKKGLEIGGPSSLFSSKGYFPVYLFDVQLDGVNYSTDTIWEGHIAEGNNYRYHNKTGYQYIKEAADLTGIADASYDFVLSCHSLEHVANPLKALDEWKRVLKPGGELVLVLPDKRNTFDINRPYTTLQHLVQDYERNVDETDNTHFEEVIALHDTSKDLVVETRDVLATRVHDNYTTRCVHHHVFSQELVKQMLAYKGFRIQYQQDAHPFHLITLAQKTN